MGIDINDYHILKILKEIFDQQGYIISELKKSILPETCFVKHVHIR